MFPVSLTPNPFLIINFTKKKKSLFRPGYPGFRGKEWAGNLTVLAVCVCVGLFCNHPGLSLRIVRSLWYQGAYYSLMIPKGHFHQQNWELVIHWILQSLFLKNHNYEVFLDRIVTSTMNYLPRLMICLNHTLIMISALHHFPSIKIITSAQILHR